MKHYVEQQTCFPRQIEENHAIITQNELTEFKEAILELLTKYILRGGGREIERQTYFTP